MLLEKQNKQRLANARQRQEMLWRECAARGGRRLPVQWSPGAATSRATEQAEADGRETQAENGWQERTSLGERRGCRIGLPGGASEVLAGAERGGCEETRAGRGSAACSRADALAGADISDAARGAGGAESEMEDGEENQVGVAGTGRCYG
jgi:hypothetical protein